MLDRWVFGVVIGYLVIAFLTSLTFDALVPWHPLVDRVSYPVWFMLYREKGPTETLQWLSLGFGVLCCGILIGLSIARSALSGLRERYAGWLVLGFGLVLLIMEDAGNIRHFIRQQVVFVLGTPVQSTALIVELIIYGIFTLIMVLGLIMTWRQWSEPGGAWKRILLGYAVYGVAGFSSASRNVGDWYVAVGGHIIRTLGLEDDARWTAFADYLDGGMREVSFLLIDLMFEESLELLAAGLILSSLLHQIHRTTRRAA